MKFLSGMLGAALILGFVAHTHAQEPTLVNEIVAHVNSDIITLNDYNNAQNDLRTEITRQMQGKSQAEIEAQIEKLKPTVLDIMIDDLLLQQKAKELGIDVEAEINEQMDAIAKENNLPNALALEQELKKQGIEPETARSSLRKQFQQRYVIQREVLQPIYANLTDKDRRDFYEKYKKEFTKPGEVTISEIFLPLEGYTAADVEQRARRIVAELRGGALSFVEAVHKYTAQNQPSRARDGKLGTFKPGEMKEDIEKAISTLKVGDITEPLRVQDGFQIVRVDERKPEQVLPFDDPKVQQAVANAAVMDQAEDARKKYLKQLREEAYIKITDRYQAQVVEEKKENQ